MYRSVTIVKSGKIQVYIKLYEKEEPLILLAGEAHGRASIAATITRISSMFRFDYEALPVEEPNQIPYQHSLQALEDTNQRCNLHVTLRIGEYEHGISLRFSIPLGRN